MCSILRYAFNGFERAFVTGALNVYCFAQTFLVDLHELFGGRENLVVRLVYNWFTFFYLLLAVLLVPLVGWP